MEQKQNEVSEDFLKEVYIQCNNIYLAFVNFRFLLFSTLISNAALFAFVYERQTSSKLNITVSIIGIIITWSMFLIDLRNRYIFKRATHTAERIEICMNVPMDKRIHSKMPPDSEDKILDSKFFKKIATNMSHSRIFLILTIAITVFWILYLAYCLFT